jgi:hypothetical protein
MVRTSVIVALLSAGSTVAVVGAMAQPAGQKGPSNAARLADVAERAFLLYREQYSIGRAKPEDLYVWSRRWMQAAQAASNMREHKLAAAQAHLSRMGALEHEIVDRNEAGVAPQAEVLAAEFYRLEAEILVARLREAR